MNYRKHVQERQFFESLAAAEGMYERVDTWSLWSTGNSMHGREDDYGKNGQGSSYMNIPWFRQSMYEVARMGDMLNQTTGIDTQQYTRDMMYAPYKSSRTQWSERAVRTEGRCIREAIHDILDHVVRVFIEAYPMGGVNHVISLCPHEVLLTSVLMSARLSLQGVVKDH